MTVRLLVGDCRAMLATLPDASVHACVTSPPYFALRRYLDPSDPLAALEMGSESSPEQFVANLVSVFREAKRVLHPSGVLLLNLGDSYAGSGKGPTGHNGIGDQAERQGFTGGRGKTTSMHWDSDPTWANSQQRAPAVGGLPAKNLLMMPARVAMALQADGWYLRSVMPWLKRAAMPESVTDRPSNALEWLFLFSKAPRYFWDAEAIRQSHTAAHIQQQLAPPKDRGEQRQFSKQGLHDFVNPAGRAFRNTDPWFLSLDAAIADARADLVRLEAMRATGGVLTDDDGLPLAVDINPAAFAQAHFATYPPALVVPFVKAGTSERGCCPRCLAPWTRIGSGEQAQFARALSEARERAGLSRKELAERLRLKSAASINDWEAGGHLPKGEKWDALAAVLNLGVTREQFAEQVTYAEHKQNGMGKYERAAVDSTVLPTFTLRKGRTRTNADGWQPACACDAGEPIPCTVLDPFAGSGTTLLVADRLGRDAVGIELSPEYARMAEARIAGDAPMLTEIETTAGDYAPLGLFGEAAS